MKILLLAHNWDYMALAPYNVGLHLSRRGYDVSLLLPKGKRLWRYEVEHVNGQFRLYFCPTILWGGFKKGSDPLDLITKLYLMQRLDYDIILTFDSRPTVILPGVWGKVFKRVPLIVYWTDWFGRNGIVAERSGKIYRAFFGGIETFFEEHFQKYADSYAVICHTLEKRLRSLGYRNRIHLFPLGCPSCSVRYNGTEELRKGLNLPQDNPLIGCVGSLYPSDARFLFETLAQVREKVDVRLVLIGKNIFRNRYQIPEAVIETGNLSLENLQKYVGACDVMVMPLKKSVANNGRWPSKLNEYLTMGKPVVSTEIAVVKDLIEKCRFGEIAKDIPEDFSQKICGLLCDKDKRNEYSQNALKLAAGYLSWPNVISDLEDFLNETVRTCSERRRKESIWQNSCRFWNKKS